MQFLKSAEIKIRQLRNQLAPWWYRGDAVYCPVCEKAFSRFLPAGTGKRRRENAVCPYCRSRERDRLAWLFLQQHPDLFKASPMQILHVAPEPRLAALFRAKSGEGYLSADLMRKDVMVKMDVMQIQYPENYFDAIYCSHVFQDVPDDVEAIKECFRVLKPGGWAILNVPLHAKQTAENVTPDNIRTRWDKRPDEHVREYGLDYETRLAGAGFTVEVYDASRLQPDAELRTRIGLDGTRTGYVHFVRKPEC